MNPVPPRPGPGYDQFGPQGKDQDAGGEADFVRADKLRCPACRGRMAVDSHGHAYCTTEDCHVQGYFERWYKIKWLQWVDQHPLGALDEEEKYD